MVSCLRVLHLCGLELPIPHKFLFSIFFTIFHTILQLLHLNFTYVVFELTAALLLALLVFPRPLLCLLCFGIAIALCPAIELVFGVYLTTPL